MQLRKEKELANREKESIVVKFAKFEKMLIDQNKEKEAVEKQLNDARKEIKNVSSRFQAVNEEKSRMTYMMDEKVSDGDFSGKLKNYDDNVLSSFWKIFRLY